jgi:hypothetical protein
LIVHAIEEVDDLPHFLSKPHAYKLSLVDHRSLFPFSARTLQSFACRRTAPLLVMFIRPVMKDKVIMPLQQEEELELETLCTDPATSPKFPTIALLREPALLSAAAHKTLGEYPLIP